MAAKKTEDCTRQQGQQDNLEISHDKKMVTQSKGDELLGKLFSNRFPIVHDPDPVDPK